MRDALTKLLLVSRPISWVNTAYPFAAGYLVLGGKPDALFFIGTLFFLIPYNLLMYGINDVFDYESDILNPRKGGLEGAQESRAFHPAIIKTSFGLCLPFVGALMFLGSVAASAVLVTVVFFVLAYSVKGLRFKEKPVLDSVTSSLHFVGPLLYAMALMGFKTSAWPYAIAFFLWGMASHAFGAVQDIIPDRAGKLASIATVLGARRTVWFSAILYVLSCTLVASTGGAALWVAAAGTVYVVNLLPYLTVSDTSSPYTNKGWRRFIWLNLFTGAVVTCVLISEKAF